MVRCSALAGSVLASVLVSAASPAPGPAAPENAVLELPPTGISYSIEARLDPQTRAIEGREEIRWTNATDEPVSTIPLHLYLNAFSHSRTTWINGIPTERVKLDDVLERYPDPWGHIEPRSIRQHVDSVDRDAPWKPVQPDDGNLLDRSLAEVSLPAPVPPGGELLLAIDFEARLPIPLARTGGRRDFFLIAQWFPKIGVIEPTGVRHAPRARSAARQFHGVTEFYADFADYDVSFSVPEGWIVGATGAAEGEPVSDGKGFVRVRYKQRAVHDFALVAGQNLREQRTSHLPQGGGPAVEIRYIVPAGTEDQIPRFRKAIEGSMDILGQRIGAYPYRTLTVVTMPHWARGAAGMEYPTLVTGLTGDPMWDRFPFARTLLPELALVHEFGHQYFYGMLASNEQEEAFLDEGFNSYWEGEIVHALYGADASAGRFLGRPLRDEDISMSAVASVAAQIREPVRKVPSFLFARGTWGHQIYYRPALILATAARRFGSEPLDRIFALYFRRFAFHHPDADDFLEVASAAGGAEVAAFLREAFERDRIPDFAVTEVTAQKWEAPLGRVTTDDGPVVITRANRDEHEETGLPGDAREPDGRVLMEVTDPGWVREAQRRSGTVTRVLVQPDTGTPVPGWTPEGFQESTVRVDGPGWDHLPVDLEFRFADGAVVRDRWDGRSVWREYRFLRAAPIRDARLDPARLLVIDVKPENNALSLEPDKRVAADWGLWLASLVQWIASGMSLWL